MASATTTPTPPTGIVERFDVDSRNVPCDGGGGALGHPRVWLHIEDTQVACPYCSRLYVLKPGAGDDGHH